jgi:hypothetical protein
MPIDPKLLTKAAKVYEAAESVEGGKPKEVYESHKQCTPGEFGMNKEGGNFAGRRAPLALGAAAAAQAGQAPKNQQPSIFSSMFQPKPATSPVGVPQPGAAAPKPVPAPVNKGIFNKMGAGNENWKGFDYSKTGPGGLIGSRTLPKSDATAKNWQGSQGTPRKPDSATAPAEQKNPPMKAVPQPMMKKLSAFAFGQLVAQARN